MLHFEQRLPVYINSFGETKYFFTIYAQPKNLVDLELITPYNQYDEETREYLNELTFEVVVAGMNTVVLSYGVKDGIMIETVLNSLLKYTF